MRQQLLLATLPLLLAAAAQAQDSAGVQTLPRVVLVGRASLAQACPQAESHLQNALEGAVQRRGDEGRMQVSFTLQGRRISEIQTADGPQRYVARVRQAVGELRCQAGIEAQPQQHRFEINFSRS